jgi:protein-disulfide isomerase
VRELGRATASRHDGKLATGAVLVGLVLGSILVVLSLSTVAGGAREDAPILVRPEGTPAERRALGPVNAPVQIVLYNDFQCAHCEKLHREAEVGILSRYVATGKAHLEVRQVAFLGPESASAAEAALCAADQGKFWEYRDALFTVWRQVGPATYSNQGLKEVARQLGLKGEVFGACVDSGARRAEVQEDMRRAESDGVRGVPTMFVNGRRLEGALPFESYAKVIDEVLSK